jgi:hypothetical protein
MRLFDHPLSVRFFQSAPITRFLISAIGAVILLTQSVMAQSATEARGMTMDDFNKAKAFKIKDWDADTYVKFDNAYVLDRYEMKPPYVFKYSDGIERRIYLYKFLDNKTKKELGLIAFYHTPANGKTINLCVPNPTADKAVWAAYIDELKYQGEAEKGLLSTFSYVMSREMSSLVTNGGQSAPSTAAKTDYDVCFPAGTLITLADGTQKSIELVKAGDLVMSYNAQHRQQTPTEVTELQSHEGKGYAISNLVLIPIEEITASVASTLSVMELEATPNHPVLTSQGRKPMQQVQAGDVLYFFDAATNSFREMRVQQNIAGYRKTENVYNLVTDRQNYLANGAVVLDK